MKLKTSSGAILTPVLAAVAAAASVVWMPAMAQAEEEKAASLSGRYLSARHAYHTKESAAAAELYASVLAKDPENSALLQRTFFALIASGQSDKAVEIAERLRAKNPRDSVAGILLALDRIRDSDYKTALTKINKASRSRLNALVIPLIEA